MMTPKHLIIHDRDPDGYLACVICYEYLLSTGVSPREIELRYTQDRSNLPEVCYTDKDVYILDLTYSREQLLWVKSVAKSLTHIDHHPSDAAGIDKGIIDAHRCTAWLTWNYYFPDLPVPWIVDVVDSYDRHSNFGNDEKKIILGLFKTNNAYDRNVWKMLLREPEPIRSSGSSATIPEQIVIVGLAEIEYQKEYIRKVIEKEQYRIIQYRGYKTAVVSALTDTPTINCLAGALCLLPNIEIVIFHHFVSNSNMLQVSFRSCDSKETDVRALAVELGGGGHVKAAGVRLSFEDGMDFLQMISR